MTVVLNLSLPKWPAMTVVGDPVTTEQAAEIIFRTDTLWFLCNDKEWERELYDVLGVKYKIETYGGIQVDYDSLNKACYAVGRIDLDYLHNSRIASSYIGGPTGWCHWNGVIFQNDRNIGKWPTVESVTTDWRAIAEAFPYLKLRSQLLKYEHGEPLSEPLVEFQVQNGEVDVREPDGVLVPSVETSMAALYSIDVRGRERGCDIETFRRAVELCRIRII